MLNQVFIVGRIVDTPQNNTITLAVQRSYKNVEGVYETDFIPVKVFGNLLEQAQEYLQKGDIVGVKGKIESLNSMPQIVAEKLTFLSSHKSQENNDDINKGEI